MAIGPLPSLWERDLTAAAEDSRVRHKDELPYSGLERN